MSDLVLINPGAAHGIKGGHEIYGDLGQDLIAVEPPLWCRLIAGYILDRGYTVSIIDQEAERIPPNEVGLRAADQRPKLVCIVTFGHQPSSSTQQMYGARLVAQSVNTHCTCPVIIVGGHVAALPERTLLEEPVDFACNGEGPVTIFELLNHITKGAPDLSAIPGLVWRDMSGPRPTNKAERIRNNIGAPLITDLDKNLHGNVWHMLPVDRYVAHNWQCFGDLSKRKPYASIYTSLGCPYKCSFCCINAPFGVNRYRMRSARAVADEIGYLYRAFHVETFKIVDEMFVLNEKHYTDICHELINRNLGNKINIWAYARVDTVKPHTLKMFRDAGIRWLALGIESGSKHVRDGASKALKNDDIVGVVRDIQRAGINVIGNYIFGLADDSMQTMQETLDLAELCNTEFANFYSAMAYPGSRLYAEAVEKGKTLPATWKGYSQHNEECRPLDTDHVSAKEVLAFRDAAFTQYFTNPKYLAMVEQKFGAETLAHVNQMTKYRLKRKLLTGEID